MNNVNQPLEENSGRRITTLAILFSTAGLTCLLFISAFVFFQPNQLSLSDQYFPSPTATLTPTFTPSPTPNLTATQQVMRATATAQAIQVLATESKNMWNLVMLDTFDTNENNWPSGIDDSSRLKINRKITNGKYQWNATSKMGVIAWIPADTTSVDDFSLSVETQRTDGAVQSDSGLVFRKDAKDNFYYFGIDDDGFFVMLNYDNQWIDIIDYTPSPAILNGKANRLTVIAQGSHFVFFINDQFAGEVTDNHIQKGTVAIAVQMYEPDLQATFEFDNFELREP